MVFGAAAAAFLVVFVDGGSYEPGEVAEKVEESWGLLGIDEGEDVVVVSGQLFCVPVEADGLEGGKGRIYN